ncbi:MAG: ATP-binding protein [Archangium sp.]|nr:ATP-binding protein [Archangium sp.]MDP3151505.1 ATP-binding protein [Archangium sp.]MDP3575397.1 ATP-binding protein [Archangium sp.]
MKTETGVLALGVSGPAADAFRAFFDMVDAPAALCDLELGIVTSNGPFEVLCGAKAIAGRSLHDFMDTGALVVPEDGRGVEVEVACRTGQVVTLSITRRGQTVALVARRLSPMLDSLAAAGRALLEQARVETALLEIGRSVAGATSEEELVATVARGVKGLFPGRAFCVRIVDPRTCHLTSLYAEGRMRDGQRDLFHLRRSMVEKTSLETRGLPADRVLITTGELPLLFQGSVRGIAAPLVASGQLFGAVNIEYPAGLTADVMTDERILIQLANQVAVAVRNAKLIDELTFMRKYLEELLENANALILVVNRDGKVVVFNHALVKLTGRSKAAVLGTEVSQLMPETERLKLLRVFGAAMKGQPVTGVESVLLGQGDREMRVAFSTSAVMSQSGEVEGVMAIGQDLTRMRELERRVIQAEKLASLGQLAASVVHEINNPMTAVSTYADALWRRAQTSPTADPADVDKYKRIVDNSERVLRFTRDLVNYARPAKDKPEDIDLNQVIEKAMGFCDHVLRKHGVTIEQQLTLVPGFLAVRQNLVQVFVNLITNACHATPSGGTVMITTGVDGSMAVVTVSDTGSGIAAETQARIFEPFFTTKPDGKGTGLGLSIVQGIIENHGGSIAVQSELGKGTTFTIRMPMLQRV